MQEAEPHLVGKHGGAERLLSRLPPLQRVVADTDRVDEADPLQGGHAPHGAAVRNERVGLVHLVEVDPTDAKPVGAGHRPLFDHRSHRQHREQLGGDDGRPARAGLPQRAAQDPFAAPERVDLGRVEERHTKLTCPPDDRRCLAGRVGGAVAPLLGAELPGTQPDRGDFLLCGYSIDIPHHSSERYAEPARDLAMPDASVTGSGLISASSTGASRSRSAPVIEKDLRRPADRPIVAARVEL